VVLPGGDLNSSFVPRCTNDPLQHPEAIFVEFKDLEEDFLVSRTLCGTNTQSRELWPSVETVNDSVVDFGWPLEELERLRAEGGGGHEIAVLFWCRT